ncbi:putative bifunctional diguanylate cyclase/phosphodiesterase [Geodermatophilus sp. SYSU D00815]
MTAPSSAGGTDRLRSAAPRSVLVLAVLLLLATVALSPRSVAGGVAALTVAVGAAAAAWVGVRRRALRRGRVPWTALTLTSAALADVVAQGVEWGTGTPPGVSVADLLRVAGYGTLAAMALGGTVGGRRRQGAALHALLDGCAALAVALLVVHRSGAAEALAACGLGGLDRALLLGYPVLGAVLVGLVAWRVVLDGRIRVAALLGFLGSGCWLAADVGRLAMVTSGVDSGLPRTAHLAGMVLLAAVPWVRSTPVPDQSRRALGHGGWRLALSTVPFTVPATLEVLDWVRGERIDPLPYLCTYGVLLALGTVRTRSLALDGKRAWAAVRSQARRFEALALNTSDAVVVVDRDGRLTADSASLGQLLGRPAVAGDDFPGLLSALGVVPVAAHTVLDRTRRRPGTAVELELEGRTDDGRPLWLGGRAVDLSDDPDVAGVVVSVYDITRRKLAERELAHQAFHDGLTGLANRRLFLDRAEQALRRAGRTGGAPVVLCLDLDGFKDVNDSLGHQAGDDLLRAVAARLQQVVRAGDTVARLGGDEFAVLLEDTPSGPADAEAMADRLLALLARPVDLDGSSVSVGTSIGLVVAEPDATPDSLLRDGDIAMYRAKAAGRRQWVAFTPGMRTAELERIELERELAGALDGGQLSLAYQPVIDLATDRVVGFEALLRWCSPTLGPVGPDRFVPVAEGSGLIVPIGRWVLAEAARTAARWQRAHGTGLTMAVNVSARQLADEAFLGDVERVLVDSGVAPGTLVLEVTETALIADPEAVGRQLAELRRMGLRIALDDFGTGYSSLSWLRAFPVDVLKIDRSFVGLLSGPGQDAAIVHGLVQLGHGLRLEVVAEGVEHEEQRDLLRAEGCDLAQGWLFSAALPAAEAERLLAGAAAGAPA